MSVPPPPSQPMPPVAQRLTTVTGRTSRGEFSVSVLLKRSYRIADGRGAERIEAAPWRLVDVWHDEGDPTWSVVAHEGELQPFRACTDVVVVGSAHAPGGRPVEAMRVGIAVGQRRKVLSVIGDRVARFRGERGVPAFSDPQPFTVMPVRYDRAYGGRDESDVSLPLRYPRNPMGRGFVLHARREAVEGRELPNIEDPEDLLVPERLCVGDPLRWIGQPLPAGLGWRQRDWYPRCVLMGTLPPFLPAGTVTAEERLGLVPPDHVALAWQRRLPVREAAFGSGASIGLAFETLAPDEAVALRGLTPTGRLDFRLPGETPMLGLDLGRGVEALPTRADTVSIRPDEGEMDITWRAERVIGPASAWARVTRLAAQVEGD